MIVTTWVAGLVLSLIAAEAFVRVSRYETTALPTEKRSTLLRTLPFTIPLMLLGYGSLMLAMLALPREKHMLDMLLPAVALAGWCACWARGLERFVDHCYPDRNLSSYVLQMVALAPISIVLIGIHGFSPLHTPLETILVSAALLPLYLLFAVFLVRRAYPGVVLERALLLSMALRQAIGFVILSALAGLAWFFLPAIRKFDRFMLWWSIPYVIGSGYEASLARRLKESIPAVETQQEVPTSAISVAPEAAEERQPLKLGR